MCDGSRTSSGPHVTSQVRFGTTWEQEERQGRAVGEICCDIFVCASVTDPFPSHEPSLCLPSLLLFVLFLCATLTCGSVTRLTERLMLHFFRNGLDRAAARTSACTLLNRERPTGLN